MKQARVAVAGSCNVDLVFGVPHRPGPGETLVGDGFHIFTGGKGANQAVAAARAGGEVVMIGRVGQDPFGGAVIEALQRERVDLTYLVRDAESGTGVAGIMVEPDGTNTIVVVPQANMRLSVADVERAEGALSRAQVLLLQLETPIEASLAAARIAKTAGATVILNPAPARELPGSLLALVDVLVPNETEAAYLSGLSVATEDEATHAALALRAAGVDSVLLTLGERGALLAGPSGVLAVPAHRVSALDTTAAGDAFCGALAVALAEGSPLPEAARFASAAGALATTVLGATPSLPARHEIERLLRQPA
ncbi:MAG TPA: ribokinase [Chloroflexota bacterium]|nr:ribokinase [Chloroflexota bacterium]